MSIVPKPITLYQCTVCGKKYKSEEEAQRFCGSYKLEPPRFAVGDRVSIREILHCSQCGKDYRPEGQVTEVIGPTVGNLVHKDGTLNRAVWGHVYQYAVARSCPYCHDKKANDWCWWTSELRRIA